MRLKESNYFFAVQAWAAISSIKTYMIVRERGKQHSDNFTTKWQNIFGPFHSNFDQTNATFH